MSSLRGQLLSVITNTLIFLLKKREKHLHCKSFSHFFYKKSGIYWILAFEKFNEMLTNDIVSFEQLGPVLLLLKHMGLQTKDFIIT